MTAYLITLAAVIVADTVGRWAFLPARHLPRNRARTLQARLHLRLHPGKGFGCSSFEGTSGLAFCLISG